MNTRQIDCVLHNDELARRTYLGCFPIDQLPSTDGSFVLNSDPSHMPGEHWICVELRGSSAVFFDSFALPPAVYSEQLHNLVYDRFNVWTNLTRLQGSSSNVCGQYCIYALQMLSRGCSPNRLLHPFSDDLTHNDRWIARHFAQTVVKRYPRDQCNLEHIPIQIARISKTTTIYAQYLV